MSFKVLNYFHVFLYCKFNLKFARAQGHFDKQHRNGHRARWIYSSKQIVAHLLEYECTFVMIYNNSMKSKEIQRNMGKMGVPELKWHPVPTGSGICFGTSSFDPAP